MTMGNIQEALVLSEGRESSATNNEENDRSSLKAVWMGIKPNSDSWLIKQQRIWDEKE